jgi:choline-sulfatase
MATALEAALAPKPGHVEFQSLLPFLKPGSTSDKTAAGPAGRPAIYGSDLDLQRSITTDGWKLLAYPKAPALRLYHLAEDPLEIRDLAADPSFAARLSAMFDSLPKEQTRLGDSLNLDALKPPISPARPADNPDSAAQPQ